MFTGIIQATGQISHKEILGKDARLQVRTKPSFVQDVDIGDSIAVNGVCLTVTSLSNDSFWADVSVETLSHTTMGDLQNGDSVNLEKTLTPNSRLGGHIVSGHVDGVGVITQCYADGRSMRVHIRAPNEIAQYIAKKGSIAVDGISLTVNTVQGAEFTLNIVPHTLTMTTLTAVKTGLRVNLEVDVIARYLERLLNKKDCYFENGGIDESFLKQHGF
jgi:riboflavin synthase